MADTDNRLPQSTYLLTYLELTNVKELQHNVTFRNLEIIFRILEYFIPQSCLRAMLHLW